MSPYEIEQGCLPWPCILCEGTVAGVAKRATSSHAGHFRPIAVVSLIYRTWSSVRSAELLQWLSPLVPSEVLGFLQGRQTADLWCTLQSRIEDALLTGGALCGATSDVVKAFDRFGRFFQTVMHRIGVAPQILTAWSAMLTQLKRTF